MLDLRPQTAAHLAEQPVVVRVVDERVDEFAGGVGVGAGVAEPEAGAQRLTHPGVERECDVFPGLLGVEEKLTAEHDQPAEQVGVVADGDRGHVLGEMVGDDEGAVEVEPARHRLHRAPAVGGAGRVDGAVPVARQVEGVGVHTGSEMGHDVVPRHRAGAEGVHEQHRGALTTVVVDRQPACAVVNPSLQHATATSSQFG